MPRIEFVFFDAGGGHRSAVAALELAIREQQLPWHTHSTNLQEALDPLDPLKTLFGGRLQDAYNTMLRREWTLGSGQLLSLLQFSIQKFHRPTVELLKPRWRETEPDMLVSCVPHFNRALRESFAQVFPGRPFVTILTDLADYPPHFWIEHEPQYFICGTDHAVAQALAVGHSPDRVFGVSGMILHPRFYGAAAVDRRRERERLGLDPDLPTGLVLFGGYGSKVMAQISRRLNDSTLAVQLILLCGGNKGLTATLRARASRFPQVVEGFTTKVSDFMQLADFFIGKPGPGSMSEAVAMHLPVIVVLNAKTLPQERYNAHWVLEKDVGIVLPSFREIEPAVARMIQPGTLAHFQANTAKLENRALFEILDVLDRILHAHGLLPDVSKRYADASQS
ncbi:MAG TPA: glycosyltransferase [Patescibacteria group bacterium]|nr:glycosyltransferase [Patescibacteria group bacterium]